MTTDRYHILLALHLIFMTAWMAGMFYLPRLLAYHAGVKKGSAESNIFKVMERRLLKGIMLPPMLLTWVCGHPLAVMGGYGMPSNPEKWLGYKLVLVLLMSALHGYFGSCV